MCHFETEVKDELLLDEVTEGLQEMITDGLVEVVGKKVVITEEGVPFVRNACMAFDRDLKGMEKREGMFSKTV